MLNVGFSNSVVADNVLAIMVPNSAPMKRLREEAKEQNRLIDATQGRKLRAIIIMKDNYVVLSASSPETLSQRFQQLNDHDQPA